MPGWRPGYYVLRRTLAVRFRALRLPVVPAPGLASSLHVSQFPVGPEHVQSLYLAREPAHTRLGHRDSVRLPGAACKSDSENLGPGSRAAGWIPGLAVPRRIINALTVLMMRL